MIEKILFLLCSLALEFTNRGKCMKSHALVSSSQKERRVCNRGSISRVSHSQVKSLTLRVIGLEGTAC